MANNNPVGSNIKTPDNGANPPQSSLSAFTEYFTPTQPPAVNAETKPESNKPEENVEPKPEETVEPKPEETVEPTPQPSLVSKISSSLFGSTAEKNESETDVSTTENEDTESTTSENTTDTETHSKHKKNKLNKVKNFSTTLKNHNLKHYKQLVPKRRETIKNKIAKNLVILINESKHKKNTPNLEEILRIKKDLDEHYEYAFSPTLNQIKRVSKKKSKNTKQKSKKLTPVPRTPM
jgi:hypothetical protein